MPWFDANTQEPSTTFEPIPPGWYTMRIEETKMKPTKNGNGEYLQLTYVVHDGAFAGRKVWDRLNINNANYQAVEIAKKNLSAICRAAGQWVLNRPEDLGGKMLEVRVTVRPADGQYDAANEARGYRAVEGKAAVPTAAPQQVQPQKAKPPVDDLPPWA